jgi:hypothetical protein
MLLEILKFQSFTCEDFLWRFVLHFVSGAMCHHNVWCHISSYIQECPKLASWSCSSVWKHPDSALWEQSRHKGQESQSEEHCVSQKEEFAGMKYFCNAVKLSWVITHLKVEFVSMLVTNLCFHHQWWQLSLLFIYARLLLEGSAWQVCHSSHWSLMEAEKVSEKLDTTFSYGRSPYKASYLNFHESLSSVFL